MRKVNDQIKVCASLNQVVDPNLSSLREEKER